GGRSESRPGRLMFTGIVEEVGAVRAIKVGPRVATLEVDAAVTVEGTDIGGSIAVNGVCLTVVERRPAGFVFEVGPETLSRTALARLGAGDPINLERPLRFGGALGGDLVLGHVDGVGTVEAVTRVESTARVRITLPGRELEPLLIPQAAGRAAGDTPGVGGGRRCQPHRGRAGRSELRGDVDLAHAGGDDAGTARAGPGDEHRGGRDRQVSRTLAGPGGADMTAFC